VEKYTGKIIYISVNIFIQSLFRMSNFKLVAWRLNSTEPSLHDVKQPWSVLRHKIRNGAETKRQEIGLNRTLK